VDEGPAYLPGDGYTPWGTGRVGALSGCLAALLFAAPVGHVFLIFLILACFIGRCGDRGELLLYARLATVALLAVLFGLGVRVLVRRWRLRGTNATPGTWSLAWSIPVVLVLGLIAFRCAWVSGLILRLI
jgi:hypothetical protein